jgi:hypothetical protein
MPHFSKASSDELSCLTRSARDTSGMGGGHRAHLIQQAASFHPGTPHGLGSRSDQEGMLPPDPRRPRTHRPDAPVAYSGRQGGRLILRCPVTRSTGFAPVLAVCRSMIAADSSGPRGRESKRTASATAPDTVKLARLPQEGIKR